MAINIEPKKHFIFIPLKLQQPAFIHGPITLRFKITKHVLKDAFL